ncbi:hypothetical protein [Streptomyces sp. NBC_01217]|uniref:hypothetical protein n=1 Tax=Streptomyces sp. NBC_01217 TaxID=2903779 RepID=UPI002E102FA3|nr:hypothetical protein OG507_35155 [Streptomyces sp. NBC_01217]
MPSVAAPGPGVRRLVITLLLSLAIAAVAHVLICGVQAQDGHHVSPLTGPLSVAAPHAQDARPASYAARTTGCDVSEAGHHPAAPGGSCDAVVLLGEAPTRSGLPLLVALLLTPAACGLLQAGTSDPSRRRATGRAADGPPPPKGFDLLRLVCVSRT